jgi:hypothetical protein
MVIIPTLSEDCGNFGASDAAALGASRRVPDLLLRATVLRGTVHFLGIIPRFDLGVHNR